MICCKQFLPIVGTPTTLNANRIWPFSSGSSDSVKVNIRLEVKHHEILDFDTGTNFFSEHST